MRTLRILVAGWVLGGAAILSLSAVASRRETGQRTANVAATLASARSQAARPVSPAGILLPVQGVEPHQLHDTFSQARGRGRMHGALDILAPRGTPVLAAVDGTIRKLFNSKAGGITIYQFDLAEERVYYYAHLERYADGLHEGQFVRQGEVIGYVGTSGNAPATTPHLHFSIEILTAEKLWWKATPVNPYPLLATTPASAPR